MTITCSAIILGRGGSKGLPGKNTMSVLGRPICNYSFLAAINSKYITDIYVSTDDEVIMDEAGKFNLHTIKRPSELCTDSALFEDALIHGYSEIVRQKGEKPDILVILMCNVITINSALIDEAIDMLIDDDSADSAVTVSKLNMYSPLRARKINRKGYLDPFVPFEAIGNPSEFSCDRDSQGDVYFADMSHCVSKSHAIEHMKEGLLPQRWMGKKIIPVHNSYGCDVDFPWQVDASLWWLRNNGFSEESTPYDSKD